MNVFQSMLLKGFCILSTSAFLKSLVLFSLQLIIISGHVIMLLSGYYIVVTMFGMSTDENIFDIVNLIRLKDKNKIESVEKVVVKTDID